MRGLVLKNILAVLPDHSVKKTDIYISGNTIVSIGEAPENFFADETIDGSYKLVTPGFINTHTHAYMTMFRNWADDLIFSDWLFNKIMPMEDQLNWYDAFRASKLACMEMIKSGVTTFVDMHMFPSASIKAAESLRMRAVISRGLSGGESDKAGGDRRLKEALDEYKEYKDHDLISFMLAPHAVYSCDPGYLEEISVVAKQYKLGIHTHLSESKDEVINCMKNCGKTPVEMFAKYDLLSPQTIAAHCVHLTLEDINILQYTGTNVSVNSSSNMKLGNGFPPDVTKLKEAGINVCLGTDGAASNNALSILREMQLLALVQKGRREDPQVASAYDIFDMATINGAKAIGHAKSLGKIEENYKADLVIWDLQQPQFTPLGDPISSLVYSASGVHADTVIIDGKIVMKNGYFISDDYNTTAAQVYETCERLKLSPTYYIWYSDSDLRRS